METYLIEAVSDGKAVMPGDEYRDYVESLVGWLREHVPEVQDDVDKEAAVARRIGARFYGDLDIWSIHVCAKYLGLFVTRKIESLKN